MTSGEGEGDGYDGAACRERGDDGGLAGREALVEGHPSEAGEDAGGEPPGDGFGADFGANDGGDEEGGRAGWTTGRRGRR
ncbi:BatC protein [Candidatus Amarobacter glycogenicus]|uniref:BatC protein n=1 Tax=Candidatus Amarobacter glycogenicus TaxID=3140699 RepID=UPI003135FD07|nr:BatC protein [Dehalococcoidia bacterium]